MPAFVGWKGNEFASESLNFPYTRESSPFFSALLSLLERLKTEFASRIQLHGSSYSPVQNDLKLNPRCAVGAVEARKYFLPFFLQSNHLWSHSKCPAHKKPRHQKTAQLKYSRLLAAMRARRTLGARHGVPKKQNKNTVKSHQIWDRWLYSCTTLVAGVIYVRAVYFNKLETAIAL